MRRTNEKLIAARKEKSLSGELRRAIAASKIAPAALAEQSGVSWPRLRGFLTASRSLESEALDRLTAVLGLELRAPPRSKARPKIRRVYVEKLDGRTQRRLERMRKLIADELPDLLRRHYLAHEAMKEATFSGALRRAIQQRPFATREIPKATGIAWRKLEGFLTGEKSLSSAMIDRLALALKLHLRSAKSRTAKAG